MNKVQQFFLIFLGAILTFFSSWSVEYIRTAQDYNLREANYKLLLRYELKSTSKALDRLNSTLESLNFFDIFILQQLDKNSQNLDEYKKQSYYLLSGDEQEKFADLAFDVSFYLSDARSLQNYYWDESKKYIANPSQTIIKTELGNMQKNKQALEDYFSKRKTEKKIELIDLKRRLDDLYKQI